MQGDARWVLPSAKASVGWRHQCRQDLIAPRDDKSGRDVARLDVREPIPVERDSILDAGDQRSEPFDLKRP